LRRTIVTSLTTFLASLSLMLLGGDVIHDFALALVLGIIIGSYSSIFIASPMLLFWKDKKKQVVATA
jgi:preprotein translocase subunit SecF